MKQFYLLIFVLLRFTDISALSALENLPAKSYREFIIITKREHKKFESLLNSVTRKAKSTNDTCLVDQLQLISLGYTKEISRLAYLNDSNKLDLNHRYQDAQLHKTIITNNYMKVLDLLNKDAQSKKKVTPSLKKAIYEQGKSKYRDKVSNKKLYDKLHKEAVSRLIKNQQFQYEKILPVKFPNADIKNQFKLKLPDNLQTVSEANSVFKNDKSGVLKSKKDRAISSGGFSQILDSGLQNFGKKDSAYLRLKINPYRFRPLVDRVKVGFDNQTKDNPLSGGFLMSNSCRITFLWLPKLMPVLSLGLENSFKLVDERLIISRPNTTMRLGFESKFEGLIGVFVNYEKTWSSVGGLIIGITNSGEEKRKFNYWLGINTKMALNAEGNPLVFRIGF